ncbi:MAG TPA: tetratricopeptide repeat protein, partial [Gemmatimonadaceae bacterium]|nr:tetratricopeptide repeat protein [Gemmatimonadaceae bacterium]
MTNPAESAAARPDREESVIEWFQSHGRAVGIGAAVVVVAAAGYWFYNRSVELKNEHADRMLGTALQSVQAGNAALAQSDLQKVVDGYRDTYSGVQAALTLAELDYDTGKPADGIKVLEGMTSAGGAA